MNNGTCEIRRMNALDFELANNKPQSIAPRVDIDALVTRHMMTALKLEISTNGTLHRHFPVSCMRKSQMLR